MHEKAAHLFEKSMRFDLAAEQYIRSGKKDVVAGMWERAGDLAQAATLYEHVGEFEKAAQCWEKLDEPVRAGKLFAKHFRKEYEASGGMGEGRKANAMRQTARHAGELLLKSGERKDAADIFYESGIYREAGELLLEIEDWERAKQKATG